jgi:hypothetical protein
MRFRPVSPTLLLKDANYPACMTLALVEVIEVFGQRADADG